MDIRKAKVSFVQIELDKLTNCAVQGDRLMTLHPSALPHNADLKLDVEVGVFFTRGGEVVGVGEGGGGMEAWVGDFVPYMEIAPKGWMAPEDRLDVRFLDEPGMTRRLTDAMRLVLPAARTRTDEVSALCWGSFSRYDPASAQADAQRREAVLNDDALTAAQKVALLEALDGVGLHLDRVDALHPELDLFERETLRACPIVPWDVADNDTRLDPHNAILVPPRVAEHFRAGLVGFDDDGDMLLAPSMLAECLCMGVDFNYQLLCLTPRQRAYLAFHREHVFGGWLAEREVSRFHRQAAAIAPRPTVEDLRDELEIARDYRNAQTLGLPQTEAAVTF